MTTVIVLIFGEFFPKLFFQLFAEQLLFFFAFFLKIIQFLLFPLVWIMVRLSEVLLKVFFKTTLTKDQHNFTRLDLEHFIAEITHNALDDIDTELFRKALYLKNVQLKDCMIPLKDIVSVEVNTSIETLKQHFIKEKFSKILVYVEKPTQIVGYVHQNKMFQSPQDIRQILFEIGDVSIKDDAYQVMNEFIKTKKSIACILNKADEIIGMITLEDILEEIFGEIEDEHDGV